MDNDAQLQALKQHLDDKFENHDNMDKLRHQRIDELLSHYNSEIKGNENAIRQIGSRIHKVEKSHDNLQTKIKTVQSIGTAIATALGAAAAWIGLTGK